MTDPQTQLAVLRRRVDDALEDCLQPAEDGSSELYQAMSYSVLNGGKRVRPLLCYAAAQALQLDLRLVDKAACAVELIHAYSLVHDDLPAMDDDDLRRGKPTCHVAYGEALAVLAGDALQALAFEVLASTDINKPVVLTAAIKTLALACGAAGMAGGQAIDIQATGEQLTFEQLKAMHGLKTGALIRCALELPAVLGAVPQHEHQALSEVGREIGLAFQIQDDILDIEANTATLGKPSGSDAEANKATFPACLGMTKSRQMVTDLLGSALRRLDELPGDTGILRTLAHYIVERSN